LFNTGNIAATYWWYFVPATMQPTYPVPSRAQYRYITNLLTRFTKKFFFPRVRRVCARPARAVILRPTLCKYFEEKIFIRYHPFFWAFKICL